MLNYLRSMRFGILLLVLIALCSVAGTLIPQGREVAWYAQTYQQYHGWILLLGLNRVFQSWYFIALLVLLCLNLSLCSLVRVSSLVKAETEAEAGRRAADTVFSRPKGVRALEDALVNRRCRVERFGAARVYRKNSFGRYGSFLTHLSILLTVIVGALALYTPTVIDQSCLPGEALTLEDGTEIAVKDFPSRTRAGGWTSPARSRSPCPAGRQRPRTSGSITRCSFGPYKILSADLRHRRKHHGYQSAERRK